MTRILIRKRSASTPQQTHSAKRTTRPAGGVVETHFQIGRAIGTTLIGMLGTLVCTGVIATVSICTKVATLSDDVARTEAQLQRHLDHAVDKEEYLRRDAQIQKALDSMATKDEVRGLRIDIGDAIMTLHEIQTSLTGRVAGRHKESDYQVNR